MSHFSLVYKLIQLVLCAILWGVKIKSADSPIWEYKTVPKQP